MAAGGCDGWYFCHSDSTGAIVQELLQEGALARSPSKSLWAGADSGLYLPGLDSCPLPRASHSCPGVAPSTQKGRENALAAVRGVPHFPKQAMKIGNSFVENIDLFCSFVTGKQSCV